MATLACRAVPWLAARRAVPLRARAVPCHGARRAVPCCGVRRAVPCRGLACGVPCCTVSPRAYTATVGDLASRHGFIYSSPRGPLVAPRVPSKGPAGSTASAAGKSRG